MTNSSNEKETLLQPAEASEFATKIVLASTGAVDVSPFEVDSVLRGLRLIEGEDSRPTKAAIEAGLPEDNQELVNTICNAADARENMQVYQDSMLNIKHWLKDAEKRWPAAGSEMDHKIKICKNEAKQQRFNFESSLRRYEIEFNQAIYLLNK